jgi:hypothetical protein
MTYVSTAENPLEIWQMARRKTKVVQNLRVQTGPVRPCECCDQTHRG